MSAPSEATMASEKRLSHRFCQNDADVKFLSSDHVLFEIHLKYLEANTGGFPPSDFKPTSQEKTELPEDSETLELLFAFIYPSRHPRLNDTSPDLLLRLADAAEKYEVYAAMNICYDRVKAITEAEPLKVLVYGFKYDYPDLINEAAPLLHDTPLPEVVQQLPQALVVPWVIYHEKWRNAIVDAFNGMQFEHGGERKRCDSCDDELTKALCELFGARPLKLSRKSIRTSVYNFFKKAKHFTNGLDGNTNALISKISKPDDFSTFL